MPSKRKPTEQQLKDRLWAMVQTIDFADNSAAEVTSHYDYDKWDADMQKRTVKTVKVGGFEASLSDINKILEEVENSCLSDKCKKSLIKALKEAK